MTGTAREHPSAEPRPVADGSAGGVLGWALLGGACGGAAWAVGLLLTALVIGESPFAGLTASQFVPDSLLFGLLGALLGGLVAGFVGLVKPRRPLTTWTAALPGGALVGALGGVITPLAVLASAGTLPPAVSSSLVWAFVGALAALTTYAQTHWPGLLAWAIAGAVCCGTAWLASLPLCRVLLGTDCVAAMRAVPLRDAAVMMIGLGAGHGLIVAGCVQAIRGRRIVPALAWGLGVGLAMALGGAISVLAVSVTAGLLPAELASSLGFATTGLLVGAGAYLTLRATPRDVEVVEPDDWDAESVFDDPTPLTVAQPAARRRSRRWGLAYVRLAPVTAVAIACLMGAAISAPEDLRLAIALLAVGALGLACLFTLLSQERRIDALERRFRSEPPP